MAPPRGGEEGMAHVSHVASRVVWNWSARVQSVGARVQVARDGAVDVGEDVGGLHERAHGERMLR